MPYKDEEKGREVRRLHYESNKESYADTRKRTRLRRRQWLDEQKSKPCTMCGNQFDPVAMDFHHRDRTTKLFEINSAAILKSMAALEAEIEKCDIYCAVCHRLVEADRWRIV